MTPPTPSQSASAPQRVKGINLDTYAFAFFAALGTHVEKKTPPHAVFARFCDERGVRGRQKSQLWEHAKALASAARRRSEKQEAKPSDENVVVSGGRRAGKAARLAMVAAAVAACK
jgi:hypothetical protein